ncbi:peptide deformylase [Streptomyces sp. NPDC004838]
MPIRPVLISGEPVLRTAALPVTRFDDDLASLVRDLLDTNRAANGAGLAANQIGDRRSVFVFDCPDARGRRRRGHIVNPVLETYGTPAAAPDDRADLEGCLSVPGLAFPVPRAPRARVAGSDVRGEPLVFEGTGELARCFQHECGHLRGQLYVDILAGPRARLAARLVTARGWDRPGHSWLPGFHHDPFRSGPTPPTTR